jgi:predicted  nucleic acid-binding Zn ribbon protein
MVNESKYLNETERECPNCNQYRMIKENTSDTWKCRCGHIIEEASKTQLLTESA